MRCCLNYQRIKDLDAYGLVMRPDDAVLYHTRSGMEIVAERELRAGYIMVDAGGYLVDDTRNSSYTRIINCLDSPFVEGLSELTFMQDLYAARYSDAELPCEEVYDEAFLETALQMC